MGRCLLSKLLGVSAHLRVLLHGQRCKAVKVGAHDKGIKWIQVFLSSFPWELENLTMGV